MLYAVCCAVCCVLCAVCCVLCALCCVLRAACCVLRAACCVLRAARCALRAARCALRAARCALRAARCALRAARCALHTAYCILHTAYCILYTVYYIAQRRAIRVSECRSAVYSVCVLCSWSAMLPSTPAVRQYHHDDVTTGADDCSLRGKAEPHVSCLHIRSDCSRLRCTKH